MNSTGDPPPSASPAPNPIEPGSGLKIIGHVTVFYNGDYSISSEYSPSGAGGEVLKYIGRLWKEDLKFLQCGVDDAAALIGVAGAVSTYLQTNASQVTSATKDVIILAGVYRIGGATALELLLAVLAVLSLTDWIALLATIGIAGVELYRLINCAIRNSAP